MNEFDGIFGICFIELKYFGIIIMCNSNVQWAPKIAHLLFEHQTFSRAEIDWYIQSNIGLQQYRSNPKLKIIIVNESVSIFYAGPIFRSQTQIHRRVRSCVCVCSILLCFSSYFTLCLLLTLPKNVLFHLFLLRNTKKIHLIWIVLRFCENEKFTNIQMA